MNVQQNCGEMNKSVTRLTTLEFYKNLMCQVNLFTQEYAKIKFVFWHMEFAAIFYLRILNKMQKNSLRQVLNSYTCTSKMKFDKS